VAEPFALGHAYRVPLSQFADDADAQLVVDSTVGIDDAAGKVRLRDGGERSFDALIAAPGAQAVSGVEGATTWWPGGDPETYGGLLRDIDEGYSKRIAIVVPPGAVWPLPAYELALMTAGQASAMGHDDVTITIVTPERRALSLFGDEASAAVTDELARAGVQLKTGVVALHDKAGLLLEPGGERVDAQRVYSVPRLLGPALEGLPADDEGFIRAGDDARVEGCERTWAAGDAVVSPIKFGGLATHQARRAAAAIARLAGVEDAPDPGEPVLHGRLMVGRRMRSLSGRGDAEGAPLWWPQGKVAGEYLPRWLTEHGVTPPAAEEPADEGITVHRPISELRGPELEFLGGLAREFRSADPAIASLGRHMREARER
jgi:sulfide:quinone oxidoreductase